MPAILAMSDQLTLGDMGDRKAPAALVVLIDGPASASAYLEGRTCLNQVARLARFVDKTIEIALSYGHTEAKWKGRGMR